MAMSMGGDQPQTPAARARAPSPPAAAPAKHSDATIQMVKPLSAAAPVQNVRTEPPSFLHFRSAPLLDEVCMSAHALQVQLAAVQNSGQFVDSGAGKVSARPRRSIGVANSDYRLICHPLFVTA